MPAKLRSWWIIVTVSALGCAALAGDGRIEIASFMLPYTITNSASYLVTENLVGVSGFDGLTISASNVTLDLNGFTLQGVPGAGSGIVVAGTRGNITIKDGFIRDWPEHGMEAEASIGTSLRDISSAFNGLNGAQVGKHSSVTLCKFYENGQHGLVAGAGSVVLETTSRTNALFGILAHDGVVVRSSSFFRNQDGGLHASNGCTVVHCAARDNSGHGIRVGAGSVVRDSASYSNDDDGIHAVGNGTLITDCTSYQNADHGISAESGALVKNNVVYLNLDDGIRVVDDSFITGNVAATNSTGLNITGTGNRIEDNHAAGNATGIVVSVSGNLVARNSAVDNVNTNYLVAIGNHGQMESYPGTNLPAGAWVNFEF